MIFSVDFLHLSLALGKGIWLNTIENNIFSLKLFFNSSF